MTVLATIAKDAADNNLARIAREEAGTNAEIARQKKALTVPFPMWSPGVRVESKRPKVAPWRPLKSKSPPAKSFVLRQTVCKRLIFLKWHGRGCEFESHQVHQNKPILSAGSYGHRVDFDSCPRSSQPMQGGGDFGYLGHGFTRRLNPFHPVHPTRRRGRRLPASPIRRA